MRIQDYDKYYAVATIIGAAITFIEVYYRCYGMFSEFGAVNIYLDTAIAGIKAEGLLSDSYIVKSVSFLTVCLPMLAKTGRGTKIPYGGIFIAGLAGMVLFFLPYYWDMQYCLTSVSGLFISAYAFALTGRKLHGINICDEDEKDTFRQCEYPVKDRYFINLPTIYRYKGRLRRGWININVFRATIVLGTPGAGKSFSVYNPVIRQMTEKGYSMFVYDYKFPDLTMVTYNELKANIGSYDVRPKFHVINFNDPRYSNRCNPLSPKYLTDPADTTEIAEVIMLNINKNAVEREDFFSMSAKSYIDMLMWFLRIYQDGKYCTLPHVIELMGQDYRTIFRILHSYPELEVKIKPFVNALSGGAQEQLQGQIASAQIPLNKFISPALYWILSANDFNLDINNPEEPKIVCIGNDPKRQSIYGTTLAVLTARMFKIINEKGKRHCGVLLDEVPTIFIKGLDNLIATARSNKVGIVLGAQDKSQLIRDYGEREANVIFNTVGNVLCGQVNGRTAEEVSRSFGKNWKRQHSQSESTDSETFSVSMQMQDVMPVNRIETLSQGEFVGKVADSHEHRIEQKFFAGKIDIDTAQFAEKSAKWSDIPEITVFENTDYKTAVEQNYHQIKQDIVNLIKSETERLMEYGIS